MLDPGHDAAGTVTFLTFLQHHPLYGTCHSEAERLPQPRRNRRRYGRGAKNLVEVEPEVTSRDIPRVRIADLSLGTILEEEIRSRGGLLVAAKGQEISSPLLIRFKNFLRRGEIADGVLVSPGTVRAQ